jgi:signal transduction histidine kinase
MKKKIDPILQTLLIDAFILILSCLNIYLLTNKPRLPFNLSKQDEFLFVHDSYKSNNIKIGDSILSIDSHKLGSNEEIEIFLDSKKANQTVKVTYYHHGKINSVNIKLGNYYSNTDIIAYMIIGCLFLLMGAFVFYKRNDKKDALIFHWVSVVTGIVIITTPGTYGGGFTELGYLMRFLFYTSYSLVPAIFIHFTIVFPVERNKNFKTTIYTFYSLSIFLAITLNILFYSAAISKTDSSFNSFITSYNVFRIYVIITIITAILIFAYSYRLAISVPEKKKLKWLLYGFIIGPFTYLILWVIPYLLFGKSFVPEIVIVLLLSAVPVTFTIAIVKYQLMDIDIIINRSIVYGIALSVIIIIYIVLVTIITSLFGRVAEIIPSAFSALIVALLFNPARITVQKYVDKYFFRIQYDFRNALKDFLQEIKDAASVDNLATRLIERTDKLIPVEKIGFFRLRLPENRLFILAHKNFDTLVGRSVKFQDDKLKTNLSQPIALTDKVEHGTEIEVADRTVFKKWGIALVLPIKSVSNVIFGFLVLGEKKSGLRFSAEDIDLLNTVTTEAAITIEKIKLQEDLILETVERQKLSELNEMKSFFVSSVSHDLKSPLTSIKMFTDLIQNEEFITSEERKKYLKIIDGENERLTRLIDNILDFTLIEKGKRNYIFKTISLENTAKEAIEIMRYQISMNNFSVNVVFNKMDNFIDADKDSVKEAVINLLSNSIKYSRENKSITIKTLRENSFAAIKIEDKGIGIKTEDIENIFKPFFRSENFGDKRIGGAGIGLSVVKHIMDAHKGKIEVVSESGKGSCFTLFFPLSESSILSK